MSVVNGGKAIVDSHEYSNTQIGWVIIVCIGAAIVGTVAIALYTRESVWVIPLVLVVLAFALVNFCTLTVRVDDERLRLHFGPGLIRKSFRLSDIMSSSVVTNPWYAGWGIRAGPDGWLFNVSGIRAVEIQMKDSTRYRIGSDEAERLDAHLKLRLGGSSGVG
jgi:hypothetical protein